MNIEFAVLPKHDSLEDEIRALREENARLRHAVRRFRAQIAEQEELERKRGRVPFIGAQLDEEFERCQIKMPFAQEG
jgi:hypothetical protein